MTEDVSRCWIADWTEVVVRHGIETLSEALTAHRKASNYLPSAHDLSERVAGVLEAAAGAKDHDRTQERLRDEREWKKIYDQETAADRQLYVGCKRCEGTGIHMRHNEKGYREIINPRNRSCPHCEGQGMLRMEAAA